jgi:hypothetical protein
MNAARDVAGARLRLVECRAVLGGERDPFRGVWDEQATFNDRKLLLAMAGEPAGICGRYAGRAWCDLSAELRGNVTAGLKRFRAWSERVA